MCGQIVKPLKVNPAMEDNERIFPDDKLVSMFRNGDSHALSKFCCHVMMNA